VNNVTYFCNCVTSVIIHGFIFVRYTTDDKISYSDKTCPVKREHCRNKTVVEELV
jgi:phenylacetate-coenzyme A ligase PaaK-like adenylate-forming protein